MSAAVYCDTPYALRLKIFRIILTDAGGVKTGEEMNQGHAFT